jgi:tetratricopeptide (TPR) repeat protein
MSVVNQMLRDLQDRQEMPKQLPLKVTILRRSNKLILVIIPLIIAAVYFYIHQQTNNQINKSSSQSNVDLLKKEVVQKPVIDGQTDPVVLLPSIALKNTIAKEVEQVSIDTKHTKNFSVEKKEAEKSHELNVLADLQGKVETQNNKLVNKSKLLKDLPIEPIEAKKVGKISNTVKSKSSASILNSQLKMIKNNYKRTGLNETKKKLLELLDNNPGFHSARLYLIRIVWNHKSLSTEQILHQAVTLYPRQSVYLLAASRYYVEENKLDKAEALLSRLELNQQQLPELYQLRGHIRQKQKKHSLAIDDYAAILNMTPNRGDIYIAIGISLEALNKMKQAHISYQKAKLDTSLSSRQLAFVENKIQRFTPSTNSATDRNQQSQGS